MAPSPRRLELDLLLKTLGGNTHKVYYGPPSNISMEYPCIVYAWDAEDVKYADNSPYRSTKRYSVTVISRDVDDEMPDKVSQLPLCSFSRRYTADKLYHTVYDLYF